MGRGEGLKRTKQLAPEKHWFVTHGVCQAGAATNKAPGASPLAMSPSQWVAGEWTGSGAGEQGGPWGCFLGMGGLCWGLSYAQCRLSPDEHLCRWEGAGYGLSGAIGPGERCVEVIWPRRCCESSGQHLGSRWRALRTKS